MIGYKKYLEMGIRIKRFMFVCICLLWGMIITAHCQSVLVEAELFKNKGGWSVDTQFIDQMGSPYLLAHGLGEAVKDAVTEVFFQQTGIYYVWVRTKDWAPYPKGPGKFRIAIDGEELEQTLGASGDAEWKWYQCGTVYINKQLTEVRLKDLTGFDGRCDALFFSKSKDTKLPDDPESLRLFRQEMLRLPAPYNEGEYDFIVVGGGVAGICAAVQAARLGLKVALINNRPVLGGNSSSEIRVPTDGDLFKNRYSKIGAIMREIDNGFAGVGNKDASTYRDDWRWKIVKNEKNISLFENMHVYAADMDGAVISGVKAINTNTLEIHHFRGQLFADCTGDASLGLLAGADHLYGRESRAQTGEPEAPEQPDGLTMGTSNQWYATLTDKVSEFPIEEWMLKFTSDYHFELTKSVWNWETGFGNFHTVEDAERIRDHNFRAIYGNWAYLKTYMKDKYGKYKLAYLSYNAGKRESYRLIGDVLLTGIDVKNKVDYPDAIVTATWGIDLHYPDKRNSKYFPGEEFIAYAVHPDKRKDVYTFPYRCLYSRNIENLFMAGRNISVTHIALGTVRVQRTTGMMGEVIGLAAFLCSKNHCSPRQLYINHLKELLDSVL